MLEYRRYKVGFNSVNGVVIWTFLGGLRDEGSGLPDVGKFINQTILADRTSTYSVEQYEIEAAAVAGHAEWCDVVKASYRIGETYLHGEPLLVPIDDEDPHNREILARERVRPIRA